MKNYEREFGLLKDLVENEFRLNLTKQTRQKTHVDARLVFIKIANELITDNVYLISKSLGKDRTLVYHYLKFDINTKLKQNYINKYEKIKSTFKELVNSKNVYIKKENKYKVNYKGIELDVYDVLKAFNVSNPATQHAIKKLLKGGERGYKDINQDYKEAIDSINRAIELNQ